MQNPRDGAAGRAGRRRRSPGRRLAIGFLAAGMVAGLVGLAFLAGFIVKSRDMPPVDLLDKVDRKLGQLVFAKLAGATRIETQLVEIDRTSVTVSNGVDLALKWGGGLTSYGPDVLVLRYAGDVFAASGPETLRLTSIAAPEINRGAYQAAYRALTGDGDLGAPPARGYDYLRYNDIEHVDSPDWHGLVMSYSEYHPDRACVTSTIAKVAIDRAITSADDITVRPEDWEVVFRTAPCLPFKRKGVPMEGHMAGGRITSDGAGGIYLASGDYGMDGLRSDGAPMAQDPQAQYGKVLHIDLESGAAETVSMGLRNTQGIARTADGRVFTVEHGMRGGDELNLHYPGANFGWPHETLGTTYAKTPLPGAEVIGRHDTFEAPRLAWLPSAAVSGLAYVTGFHPAWEGDLLAASLKDASLYRIRLDGDRVVYAERIPIGSRIRYVLQHGDGRIVLWTDNHELIFLRGRDLVSDDARIDAYLAKSDLPDPRKAALKTALLECAECHSFETGSHTGAPGLGRIYGDRVASTPFDGYSDALKGQGGSWTDDSLAAFIGNPQNAVPGTSMPDTGLRDPQTVADLVVYLKVIDAQR